VATPNLRFFASVTLTRIEAVKELAREKIGRRNRLPHLLETEHLKWWRRRFRLRFLIPLQLHSSVVAQTLF
jgi:hypothetical protein